MSVEMFGYVVKKVKNSDYKEVNLYIDDKYAETNPSVAPISIGNASAFRDNIETFIDMANDYDIPEDANKWDGTFFISLDRMKVRKYELEKRIKNPYKVMNTDIYNLNDDEILYYMLTEFIDEITWYIHFADPYEYNAEYYFKFQISY